MSQYLKFIVALLGALVTWVGAVVNSASGPITAAEWYAGLAALVTVVSVFLVPNTNPIPPPHPEGD